MITHFDPRQILRQISNQQLREFFRRLGHLTNLPWGELSETQIEPIFASWQGLPEKERTAIQMVFQDIHELWLPCGLKVLAEEIAARYPELAADFTAIVSRADKAMWAYLNLPDVFAEAILFARAIALSRSRYWVTRTTLPHHALRMTADAKNSLRAAMAEFYWRTQLRGSCVEIEHYRRSNGVEHLCVYLDDYPDRHLVFNEQRRLEHHAVRMAFDNLFVFDPQSGTLSLYAPGGKKVQQPLLQAFCRTLLGIELGPLEIASPVFQLDHLLALGGSLKSDPTIGVADASILELTVDRCDVPDCRVILEANPDGLSPTIREMISSHLDLRNIPLACWTVSAAKFRVTCLADGSNRPRTLTFSVRCPCWSDLKSKSDDLRAIGELCLKLWEVTHD
jgi:hypothetical protein